MDGTIGLAVRDVYNQKLYAQHVFLRPLDVQVYKKNILVVQRMGMHGGGFLVSLDY